MRLEGKTSSFCSDVYSRLANHGIHVGVIIMVLKWSFSFNLLVAVESNDRKI